MINDFERITGCGLFFAMFPDCDALWCQESSCDVWCMNPTFVSHIKYACHTCTIKC